MNYSVKEIQEALNKNHGFSLKVDGIMGPNTENAISDLKARNGMRKRPYIGPLTAELIFGEKLPQHAYVNESTVPWVNELGRYLGYHEVRNKSSLMRWLKSDGETLGDPSKLPWCGDAMHTALRLTLPKEPFPGNLGKNPYWARNWTLLGVSSCLKYGVMVTITRGKGGHIATAVGYDPVRKRIRVRGGNQSNTISDTWVNENRLIGYRSGMNIRKKPVKGLREPSTYRKKLPPIPLMNSNGAVISRNEA